MPVKKKEKTIEQLKAENKKLKDKVVGMKYNIEDLRREIGQLERDIYELKGGNPYHD